MNAELLESRLSQRPSSPLFARLAMHYLEQGDPERGAMLCRGGLEHFPGYASAHVVLARCLAARSQYRQACEELSAALRLAARTEFLERLRLAWEAEEAAATVTQAPEPELAAAPPPEVQEPELSPPPSEVREPEAAVAGPEPAVQEPGAAAPAQAPHHVPEPERAEPPVAEEDRIVSRTLAEIYARQGEYLEAIITYQLLKRQRPELAGEFDGRIQELEIKLQEKLAG